MCMETIRFDHVFKSFGDICIFRDFSHSFPAGRVSCVLGASGCGKTTLLRMLLGLEEADSGRIIKADGLRISVVFQEDRLFERLSALKNVMLTARADFSSADALALLDALGLLEAAQRRVEDFSGGMKRRTAIARALAADFDLLVLDEPLGGLDDAMRLRTLEVIKKMTAGKTVIFVTHELSNAEYMGAEVLILKNQNQSEC